MTTQNPIHTFVLVLLLVPLSLLGCVPVSSKPVVSIGSPPHGAQVNLGQEVLVQATAADANGVARVELWVDGALLTMSQPPSPQTSHSAVLRWTPASAGAHLLMVKAINSSGIWSESAAVTVNVMAQNAPMTAVPPTTAACENNAAFVQHVTVPDGTNWMPGQTFNKIWRVRNTGTCPWGPGYELVFVGGEAMTAQSTFIVPVTASGSTADLPVAMTAPAASGTHSGQWRLRNSQSGLFGATMSVSINVLGSVQAQPQPPAQPPPPGCAGAPTIASLDANPATLEVLPGFTGQTTLSWGKVDNANSAVIDNGIGGVGTPGSTVVSLGQTTTFTLVATGCGGTTTKQVTVTVKGKTLGPLPVVPACPGPPVIASFTANPSTIEVLPGFTGQTTLSWDVKNATNVELNPWVALNGTSGSRTIDLGQTTTYTLTATGCGGTATKQLTITVKLRTFTMP